MSRDKVENEKATRTSEHEETEGGLDWRPVNAWLESLRRAGRSASTIATYLRETRRLQWYCKFVSAPKPWAWTNREARAYLHFLVNQSESHVCPPGLRPHNPNWTPFRKGKRSAAAMSATTSILIQMFDYLVKVGHSLANPFQGCEVEKPVGHPSGSRGAIPPLILDHVLNVMDRRAKTSPTEMRLYWRNRFVLVLYCRTGLRATEGVQANMSDIQEIPNPATGRTHWALCVQEELVHLDAVVLEALIAYRRAFLLPDVPPPGETLGLVLSPFTPAAEETSIYGSPNSRRGRRMWKAIRTRQSIRNIVRDEFNAAAAQLPADSPQAALLKRASTQWLRHTRGAALAAAGVDTPILAKAMRYRSVRTAKTFEQVNFFDVAGLSDQ